MHARETTRKLGVCLTVGGKKKQQLTGVNMNNYCTLFEVRSSDGKHEYILFFLLLYSSTEKVWSMQGWTNETGLEGCLCSVLLLHFWVLSLNWLWSLCCYMLFFFHAPVSVYFSFSPQALCSGSLVSWGFFSPNGPALDYIRSLCQSGMVC